MPSDALHSHATVRSFVPHSLPRLTRKPDGAAKGFFDGGWWPRTREPVAEFSALVAALGPVDRIGFSTTSWELAPHRLVVGENTVRLVGFRGLNPHTIILIGPHLLRLTLLVVPAATARSAAETALAFAAASDNTDDAAGIFTASGTAHP